MSAIATIAQTANASSFGKCLGIGFMVSVAPVRMATRFDVMGFLALSLAGSDPLGIVIPAMPVLRIVIKQEKPAAMIASICRENLVKIADTYARATRSSKPAVSKKFYGNAAFLDRFRRGEVSISIEKYDEIVSALIAGWPPKAKWPALRAIVFPRPGKNIPN